MLNDDNAAVSDQGSDEVKIDAPKMYGDARIITPYNETDYERSIIVTIGSKRESKSWKPQPMPLAALIGKLCQHQVGQKDGLSLVFADMVPGQRLKNSVRTVTAIGLDIDTGTPTAVIDTALAKLKCLAVRYSTHSNNKTVTEFKKDKVLNKYPDAEIDTDLMRQFCSTIEHWDQTIVDTIEYVEEDHTEKGIVVRINHMKMPKHRVIVPLKEPYEIAKEGKTQLEATAKWAQYPAALAALLGVPFDRSCTDPSRLYYLPRHDKGKDFDISLFGGPEFDRNGLQLGDEYASLVAELSKKGGKSKTEEGKKLGRWSMKTAHGFQIANALEAHAPDKLRGSASMGFNIECPFDEDHSNPDDPSDRACFAVNAADGGNELFIISCRHETCRDKTNLDMLGKMIKDGWFAREVLDNPDLNIAVADEEASSEKDSARSDYLSKIELLTPDSSEVEVNEAVSSMMEAVLSVLMRDRAEKLLGKRLKLNSAKVKKIISIVRAEKAARAPESTNAPNDGKETFRFEHEYDFAEATDACKSAILSANAEAKRPIVSIMDGYPVFLSIDGDGRGKLEDMTRDSFWSYLTSLLAFVRTDQGCDGVRAKVPEDVAKYVFERCEGWLPSSPAIVYTPALLADGALLETPGYHFKPEFGLNHLYLMTPDFVMPPIPEPPTKIDAENSLEWIRTELLNDFPFLDTDGSGVERRNIAEANALAMLFTPIMRPMIPGRTPMFIVSKPTGGTGGSLFAGTPSLIHQGEVATYIRYSNDPEEMQKALIAQIRSGATHLFFDDVKELTSRELLRNLTAPKVAGRRLGTNDIVEAPNTFNWNASGNNVVVDDQMDRRSVWVRMNAKKSDVSSRAFRHGGRSGASGLLFDEFCRQQRGTIVAHIITIILYWFDIGAPVYSGKAKNGFELWSDTIGGVLEAVGVEGFLEGKSGALASPQAVNDSVFMQEWLGNYGLDSVNPTKVFEWARDMGSAILRGNGDDQRRTNFFADMQRLTDNTFRLASRSGDAGEFEFKAEVGGGSLAYCLKRVAVRHEVS